MSRPEIQASGPCAADARPFIGNSLVIRRCRGGDGAGWSSGRSRTSVARRCSPDAVGTHTVTLPPLLRPSAVIGTAANSLPELGGAA